MHAQTFFAFENMRPPEFGGDYDTALENYYQLIRRTGLRDGCLARQVHGVTIVQATEPSKLPILPLVLGEADAVWTDRPALWVGVLTADCLPVLLDAGERVMAVHAGWRGLAAGLLARAVDFLGGGSAVVSATLGPAARGCCYEVGDDVLAACAAGGIEPVLAGRNLDMPETGRRELERLGVRDIRLSEPFGCTICDPRFHSYRRTPENTGRNLAAIALVA